MKNLKLNKSPGEAGTPLVGLAADGLPEEVSTAVKPDPLKMIWMFIGPPGFGKTTTFMAFPRSILLAFEAGHMFLNGMKIVIEDYTLPEPFQDESGLWHMGLIQVVELICKSDRIDFVIIDTANRAIQLIQDHFLKINKAEHPDDLGEYGKGYEKVRNKPFRDIVNKLVKSGKGIGFITHSSITTKILKNKKEVSKKETTLPDKLMKEFLFPMMDVIIHGEFGEKREGQRNVDRIVVTEPSEAILCKNRSGYFPGEFLLPTDSTKIWPMIEGFFEDPKNIEKAEKELKELGY